MAKYKIKILREVSITGIADKGKGVGRTTEGLVVFAEGAVPGDVIDVLVQKKKNGFAEGKAIHTHIYSPLRVEPFCQHFELCGGCKWQHLTYEKQLEYKQTLVEDALLRIGKLDVPEMLPILGADENTYYRNKMEFAFSPKRWLTQEEIDSGNAMQRPGLGFHKSGAFDKIIDLERCWLQAEPSNAVRNSIKQIALEREMPFYDQRTHQGILRQVMFRLTTAGELMVVFSVATADLHVLQAFFDKVLEENRAHIHSLVYCVNTKLNDYMFDLPMHTYYGKGFVTEQLGNLHFKIGPKSFFQTNSRQGNQLYDVVVDFAQLQGTENVYDLYTGTGSIALYVAQYCRQVVGIEEIPEAIHDAEENMKNNQITNAIFYAGDVKNVLTPAFVQKHGRPDIVITDPPRVGMHEKAVQFLFDLAAPRMVYVSCNPATQARDLQWLSPRYEIVKSRAVDMFPHTHHIENVVLLKLKA